MYVCMYMYVCTYFILEWSGVYWTGRREARRGGGCRPGNAVGRAIAETRRGVTQMVACRERKGQKGDGARVRGAEKRNHPGSRLNKAGDLLHAETLSKSWRGHRRSAVSTFPQCSCSSHHSLCSTRCPSITAVPIHTHLSVRPVTHRHDACCSNRHRHPARTPADGPDPHAQGPHLDRRLLRLHSPWYPPPPPIDPPN